MGSVCSTINFSFEGLILYSGYYSRWFIFRYIRGEGRLREIWTPWIKITAKIGTVNINHRDLKHREIYSHQNKRCWPTDRRVFTVTAVCRNVLFFNRQKGSNCVETCISISTSRVWVKCENDSVIEECTFSLRKQLFYGPNDQLLKITWSILHNGLSLVCLFPWSPSY